MLAALAIKPSLAETIITDTSIKSDAIDYTPIGAVSPSTGAFTTLKASTDPVDEHGVGDRGYNDQRYLLFNSYGVTWDESGDAYTRTGFLTGVATGSSPGNAFIPIQAAMRRCLMADSGVVQYYLDPTDSTKKVGGGAAVLTGADGQVMVEIPAFYYRYAYSGTSHTWDISFVPFDGFSIHPAFIKNGAFVPYRYIGAYEGSMYDASTGAMVPDADIEVAYTMTSGDKLCSISGQYPKTNETRNEFRLLAAMRGDGWRNQDYDLISAIQLLYLVEYASFNSQAMIGTGRTMFSGGAWEAANQGVGKYIGQCGYSNGDGNVTNATNRASAVSIAAINTDTDVNYHDYMSYRGIENFFGNVWKWVDGINVDTNIVPFVSNDDTDFADDTATNYTPLGVTLPASGWQATLHQQDRGFLPASVGASDSTKITDYIYTAAGTWRVVKLGGYVADALDAGAFYVAANNASTYISVNLGCRLAF